MKEILFRGKRADNNEWVYGSYHCLVGDAKMREAIWGGDYRIQHRQLDAHYILERILPDAIGWDIKKVIVAHQVIKNTIGQFTGYTDKNERDIYAGDVFGSPIQLRCIVEREPDGRWILRFLDKRMGSISILDHKVARLALN